jgi:hypothetical protein
MREQQLCPFFKGSVAVQCTESTDTRCKQALPLLYRFYGLREAGSLLGARRSWSIWVQSETFFSFLFLIISV